MTTSAVTPVPCLRCRKPLRTAPTTWARIYLCVPCIEQLGGEKKAVAKMRREWRPHAD